MRKRRQEPTVSMTDATSKTVKREDKLSFSVDRFASDGLVDQLVASMRRAVDKGELKPGEVLPGMREIAERLGVSLRVPREAVGRLMKEGLLSARRGCGTVVSGKTGVVRSRRVLVLHQESDGSYYLNRIFETVCKRLSLAGMTVIREVVPYLVRGEKAMCGVRGLLERESFDCALVMLYEDDYFALLDQFGIPYVACALRPKRYPGAEGLILNSLRTAAKDFAADCLKKRVRRVLQISHILDVLNLEEVFRSTDVAVETLRVPVKSWEVDHTVEIQKRTWKLLGRRLDRGDWPDVIFLCDDVVARGGLLALYERNIRFPEDVGLVVWSNRGNDVLSFRRLTAMEMDVPQIGERMAEEFLRFVQTGRFAKGLTFGPDYVRGESF